MLKSDTDLFVESWSIGTKYVFVTYNWFNKDYVVIEKKNEEEYVCLKNSTSNMGSFTKNEMTKLIGSGIFVYMPFEHWDQDWHFIRSGGCDCGAASTNNPDKHDFGCKKYKK